MNCLWIILSHIGYKATDLIQDKNLGRIIFSQAEVFIRLQCKHALEIELLLNMKTY